MVNWESSPESLLRTGIFILTVAGFFVHVVDQPAHGVDGYVGEDAMAEVEDVAYTAVCSV